MATDVTQPQALNALADHAVSAFGRLDIWVNNAGGSPIQIPMIELPVEEWDATIALNLSAIFHAVRAAMRHMAQGGRIVNISSIAAEDVFQGSGHYSAAKAGVNMLTRTLAHELGPSVRVNAVLPGFVPTEVMKAAMNIDDNELPDLEKMLKLPAGRLGTPEDLAACPVSVLTRGGVGYRSVYPRRRNNLITGGSQRLVDRACAPTRQIPSAPIFRS